MLGGIAVITVEPGTEIEHEGEKLVVTDTEAVLRGHVAYVTPKVYDLLKDRQRPAGPGEAKNA